VELPEVTEIQRWKIEPGDRLILRTDRRVDQAQAEMIRERVRYWLALPADVPVVILDGEWTAEVVSDGRS
jgi:hypothetical protein